MGRKTRAFRGLLDKVDLVEESVPREPLVELLGEGRVLIENHKGVTQYCTEAIQVCVSFGAIRVVGCNLRLRLMTEHKLVIYGTIGSVELIRGRTK